MPSFLVVIPRSFGFEHPRGDALGPSVDKIDRGSLSFRDPEKAFLEGGEFGTRGRIADELLIDVTGKQVAYYSTRRLTSTANLSARWGYDVI